MGKLAPQKKRKKEQPVSTRGLRERKVGVEYLAVARFGGRTAPRLQAANHPPSMSISLLVDPPIVSIRAGGSS